MSDRQATIMVVDDTPANLRLLQEMLQGKDYRVLAFPSGKMALCAAAKTPPDLILLDVNMPEMSGFDVCERLKADAALKEIPVLFISALTETADKLKAFSVGGVDYVTKPFEFEEVQARVETHLALRRYQLEILDKNRELDIRFKKLTELEALREALTHMIVHDLRSPLSGIMGYLDILNDEAAGSLSEEHRHFLRGARASTTELMNRINTVLDVSRLDEGAMPVNLLPVNIVELAQKAISSLGGQSLDRNVLLEAKESPVQTSCDPDLIGRVLANLLHNAIKFSPKHSVVRIIVEHRDAVVRVAVQDEGCGVPPEHREIIFEKFKQVETWKDGQRRGTGLGLAFCKLAVEAHGGSIGIDCPPDGGSIFWFHIPARRD